MIDLARTYYWHSNSSGADGTGWGVRTHGWGGTEGAIQKALDRGITRVINRGPEGDDGNWPLDFYVPDSVSPHLKAEPIRDHTKRVYAMGVVEYIPYFGSLSHDSSMAQAGALAWRWRYDETTRPWAACSAWAFDHIGAHGTPGTPAYYALRLEQALGRTIYGEPHGDGIDSDLDQIGDELDGCIVLDTHWRSAWKKAEFRERWKGDVIRILRDDNTLDEAKAILDEGHKVALSWGLMNKLPE